VSKGVVGERFFYVHLQKTAGTSLVMRLRHAFGENAVYPCDEIDGARDQRTIMVDHLIDRWHQRGDEIAVVAGHFPMATIDLLDADFSTFTVLRDPVERTLSYLRYHRMFFPADAHLSLEEVYEDPFRFDGMIHNHMTKMFSLGVDEIQPAGMLTVMPIDRQRCETAKRQLELVDVVGLQEEFGSFCDELSLRFDLDLGPELIANATRQEAVDDSLRDRIAHDNAFDVELYQYAQDLVATRADAKKLVSSSPISPVSPISP